MLGHTPLPGATVVQKEPCPMAILGDLRLPEVLADGKERVYPNIRIPGRNEVISDVMSFLICKVSTFYPC